MMGKWRIKLEHHYIDMYFVYDPSGRYHGWHPFLSTACQYIFGVQEYD